jgi:hypothetical protein
VEKVEIRGDADATIAGEIAGALHDATAEAIGERVDRGFEAPLAFTGCRQQIELTAACLRGPEIVCGEPDEAKRPAFRKFREQGCPT